MNRLEAGDWRLEERKKIKSSPASSCLLPENLFLFCADIHSFKGRSGT